MARRFSIYRGIPIGLIIKKDLKMKKLSQKSLAQIIDMSYTHLNKCINGQRDFKKEEADKIDVFFKYERSFVYNMQRYRKEKALTTHTPAPSQNSIPIIRKCVFWDTDPNKLEWIKHRKYIINRVVTYGNKEERQRIIEFYNHITQ